MALASPVPATDRNAPAARREEVRQRVLSEGFVRVEDLVRLFEVSLMTIHRDLDVLEADGWLTKIRGGATANPSALLDAGVPERLAALHVEKEAIAAVAARQLSQGQTIFLDDSTTALSLVPYLREHAPITVATNFLPAVVALGGAPAVDVHLLGGEYHPRQDACFGLQTVEAISRLQADLFFMSTTALTHGRCLHRSEATIGVRRAYLAASTRRVLLVDHAKFGRPSPHVLCGVEEFDLVITDEGIDPEDLSELRDRNVEVEVAPVRR
jgi:DeoR/GlpR family transcriptional regulator of sugar metabolism